MLPGFMCNEMLWKKLIPLLEHNYELIHLNIPNKQNIDYVVDALHQKITDKKANILGFSLGGYFASYYGFKYPNNINKLMIISSSCSCLSKDEIKKRELGLEFIKKFGFNKLSKKAINSMLDEKNIDNKKLIDTIQDMYISLGEDTLFDQLKVSLHRRDLSNLLLKTDIPMFFIYSINDKLLDIDNLNYLEQNLKKSKFLKINSTSHMLPLEKQLVVSEAIKDWF
ncbi:MAG: alpha/beta fold hydrolase [Halarcobacter sp.]